MLTRYQPEWPQRYADERERLTGALGLLTDAGIIENIAHIGSTSIPGMAARESIDIGLSVWPFPLTDDAIGRLASLGYIRTAPTSDERPQGDSTLDHDADGLQLQHDSDQFRLFIYDAGNRHYHDHLLVRNYLRENKAQRTLYYQQRLMWADSNDWVQYEAGKQVLLVALLGEAHQWWIEAKGFDAMQPAIDALAELHCPWTISSGWAIDLFVEQVTRYHHDVDVVIDRNDQLLLQAYLTERGWKMVAPYKGTLERWPEQMALQLPRHQIHAHRNGEFIDILLTDFPGGVWQFRREPTIVKPIEKVRLATVDGLNYLAPEVVLLFKAKNTGDKARPQDRMDFETALPKLNPEQRAWLRWALLVANPGHPWAERLR